MGDERVCYERVSYVCVGDERGFMSDWVLGYWVMKR